MSDFRCFGRPRIMSNSKKKSQITVVACTPNEAYCFVSPLYVGSISDVELTRVSSFMDVLKDKPGVSIMADKGFTIRDICDRI